MQDMIKRLQIQGIMTLKEVHQLTSILEIIFQQSIFVETFFPGNALPRETKNKLYQKLINPLRTFVDYDGNIEYPKHPALSPLYRELTQLDLKTKEFLKQTINELRKKDIIQIDTYDIISGHYVIIVKSDHYNQNLGRIIARSDSGQTLYLEPYELHNRSLERQELSTKLEQEIYRISIEFAGILNEHYDFLKNSLWILHEIDYYFCLAGYCQKHNLSKPKLAKEPKIILEDFYHPLLETPVKNDLKLTAYHRGLVVSGPNTGGKTITLKSLCLAQLMLHMGLYIPAAHAEMYPFDEVYFISQDHQNISEGLSSFSSESKFYLELTKNIGNNAIVFIDEIFNSTSSEEASALALGFFDYLKQKSDPFILVSTHHQMLKVKVHEAGNFLSCHVGFDQDNHVPTYKLHFGTPGSSQAIDIFEKISPSYPFAHFIIDKAKSILDTKYIEYEKLLHEVSQKNAQLQNEIITYKELNDRLKNELKSQEGLLKIKREEEIQKFSFVLKKLEEKALSLIEDIKKDQFVGKKKIEKHFREIKDDLHNLAPEAHHETDSQYPPLQESPVVGKHYLYIPMQKNFEVIRVDENRKKATIQKGPFRIDVSFRELSATDSHPVKAEPSFEFSVQKERIPQLVLDARGLKLDEFQEKVHLALSDLYIEDIPFIEIIHGHGEGVLKKWIRDFCEKSKDLSYEIPKQSADGMTRIYLKSENIILE